MKVRFKHRAWVGPVLAAALLACGDRAATYLEDARRLERDYDYEKAAHKYDLVAEAFKRTAAAAPARAGLERCRAGMHFDRAEELIYAGASFTALEEVAAGRRLAPDDPRGLYYAGLFHLAVGPTGVALREFDQAVLRYPASPYGYLGRAEYYRWTQARDVAFDEYVRAFRVAGPDARARGAAFRGLRDMAQKLGWPLAQVEPYYQEGAAAVPRAAFAYWVGFYYLHKEPVVVAVAQDYFEKALKSAGPELYRPRANAGLAACYAAAKDYPRARACIDAAMADDAENDAYYKIAAGIYAALHLPPPVKAQK